MCVLINLCLKTSSVTTDILEVCSIESSAAALGGHVWMAIKIIVCEFAVVV